MNENSELTEQHCASNANTKADTEEAREYSEQVKYLEELLFKKLDFRKMKPGDRFFAVDLSTVLVDGFVANCYKQEPKEYIYGNYCKSLPARIRVTAFECDRGRPVVMHSLDHIFRKTKIECWGELVVMTTNGAESLKKMADGFREKKYQLRKDRF